MILRQNGVCPVLGKVDTTGNDSWPWAIKLSFELAVTPPSSVICNVDGILSKRVVISIVIDSEGFIEVTV